MIRNDDVVLEEIDEKNLDQMRQWRNMPEMRRYFREWRDITVAKQIDWYNKTGNNSSPNNVHFQIMKYDGNIDNRELIGYCGLLNIDFRIRSAEFSVYLGSGRGKGCGKKALLMLFDYGFKEINLHKIWCEVYDLNTAVEVYRKIGFVDEGILRDNQFCEGKYINSYRLSMLESEWKEKYGGDPLWKMDKL